MHPPGIYAPVCYESTSKIKIAKFLPRVAATEPPLKRIPGAQRKLANRKKQQYLNISMSPSDAREKLHAYFTKIIQRFFTFV